MPTKIKRLPDHLLTATGVYIFVGRRKSGKTVNIMTLLYKLKDKFDFGVCFCGSMATSNEYAKHMPRKYIHDELDVKIIEALIHKQESDLKEKKKCKRIFLLMDDIGFDGKAWRSKVMKKIFMNGRHYNMCIIIALQYVKSIGPSLRSNTDYIIASREKSVAYRRKLYDEFNICFENFQDFDRAFDTCTLNYDSFVLANALQTTSNKVEDNVFYYKSIYPEPQFIINAHGKWLKKRKPIEQKRSSFRAFSIFKKNELNQKWNF